MTLILRIGTDLVIAKNKVEILIFEKKLSIIILIALFIEHYFDFC